MINNSKLTRELTLQPIPGIVQNINPFVVQNQCGKTFTLAPNQFCYLSLVAVGPLILLNNINSITSGPIICKTQTRTNGPDPFLCERPEQNKQLNLKLNREAAAITIYPNPVATDNSKELSITTTDGGYLLVSNLSKTITAKNIMLHLELTHLEDYLTQDASACASLAPLHNCRIYITPVGTALAKTPMVIFGDNTNRNIAFVEIAGPNQAMIKITAGSPMVLQSNNSIPGPAQSFTIQNVSQIAINATNINLHPDATLSPLISYTPDTACSSLAPGDTCSISVTANPNPNNTTISDYPVAIYGSNTAQALGIIIILVPEQAAINIDPNSLPFTADGTTQQMKVTNSSSTNTAYGITTSLTESDGIYVSGDTCASGLAPNSGCTLSFTSKTTAQLTTSPVTFQVYGTNTNIQTATYSINQSISSVTPNTSATLGGTLVTIKGTGLTNANKVSFGSLAAQSFKVLSSTEIQAITPAVSTTGSVDVAVTTPAGTSTLNNGFTYTDPMIGQETGGGTIACTTSQGGFNLIVYPTSYGNFQYLSEQLSVASASSHTDGAANSQNLVNLYGKKALAANICMTATINAYGIPSCTIGSEGCFSDWFLPAIDQLSCLNTNKNAAGITPGVYWSSTSYANTEAYLYDFDKNLKAYDWITASHNVVCVRSF